MRCSCFVYLVSRDPAWPQTLCISPDRTKLWTTSLFSSFWKKEITVWEHTHRLVCRHKWHKWFRSYLLWCKGAFDALLELSWSVSVSSKLDVFLSLLVFFCNALNEPLTAFDQHHGQCERVRVCVSKLTLRLEKLPMNDLARRLLVLGLDSSPVSVVSSPFPWKQGRDKMLKRYCSGNISNDKPSHQYYAIKIKSIISYYLKKIIINHRLSIIEIMWFTGFNHISKEKNDKAVFVAFQGLIEKFFICSLTQRPFWYNMTR